jgi:copper chaperone CopZ
MMHRRLELAAVLDAAGAAKVATALQAVKGVSGAEADAGSNLVAVAYDSDRTSAQELGAVLASAGYPLREQRKHSEGSCCGGCGG